MNLKIAWEDFYKNKAIPQISQHLKGDRFYRQSSFYLLNSIFRDFKTNLLGGSIFIDNKDANALIEDTSFIGISSTALSAAIYANVKNIGFNKVCGFSCSSSYEKKKVGYS